MTFRAIHPAPSAATATVVDETAAIVSFNTDDHIVALFNSTSTKAPAHNVNRATSATRGWFKITSLQSGGVAPSYTSLRPNPGIK